jgi:DNA replication and repair protein RecF
LILTKLQLTQFKNHKTLIFSCGEDFNIISGDNGVGKTNVLDAVYAACTGRCYFNRSDKYNIQEGTDFAVIQAEFKKTNEQSSCIIGLKKRGPKSIKIDGGKNIKITDYIGMHPVVFIGPSDILLVNGRADERRKFLDGVISQCSQDYLRDLLLYNKLIDMRNKQLKLFAESSTFDPLLLETIDEQIFEPAQKIYSARKKFLKTFIPFFVKSYSSISDDAEIPQLMYSSHLSDNKMSEILKMQLPKDRILERTSRGVHKDDLQLSLGDFETKQYGSQGQIKTFVIALKLAAYQYLKSSVKSKPILLLDDIFEKIDGGRAARLLQMLRGDEYGQIFITDTEKKRVHSALKGVKPSKTDLILTNSD